MKSFKQFLLEREDLGVREPSTSSAPASSIEDRLKEPLKPRSEFSSDDEYKKYMQSRMAQTASDSETLSNREQALTTAINTGEAVRTGVEGAMSVMPGGRQAVAATRAISAGVNYGLGDNEAAMGDLVAGAGALIPGGSNLAANVAINAAKGGVGEAIKGGDIKQIAQSTVAGAVSAAIPGLKDNKTLGGQGAFEVAKGLVSSSAGETVTGIVSSEDDSNTKPVSTTTTVASATPRPSNINKPRV